jgi:hypothetical protein
MYKSAIFALALLATPAMAQDSGLNFDPAQLCAWQSANNGMDTNECVKLEEDAKISLAELETSADAPRKELCTSEAKNFSSDSGFASYAVFASCLRDGVGSQ